MICDLPDPLSTTAAVWSVFPTTTLCSKSRFPDSGSWYIAQPELLRLPTKTQPVTVALVSRWRDNDVAPHAHSSSGEPIADSLPENTQSRTTACSISANSIPVDTALALLTLSRMTHLANSARSPMVTVKLWLSEISTSLKFTNRTLEIPPPLMPKPRSDRSLTTRESQLMKENHSPDRMTLSLASP